MGRTRFRSGVLSANKRCRTLRVSLGNVFLSRRFHSVLAHVLCRIVVRHGLAHNLRQQMESLWILVVRAHFVHLQFFSQVQRFQQLVAVVATLSRNENGMAEKCGAERLFPEWLVALHIFHGRFAAFALNGFNIMLSPWAGVHKLGSVGGHGP